MKKSSISKVTLYLISLLVVFVIYVLVYFLPAQNQLKSLRSEIAVSNVETVMYQKYLEDPSILEADIQSIQDEIDRMNAEDYINDTTVSFEIADAVQRYHLKLTSVSLSDITDLNGHRVLPITVTMSGSLNNIIRFIRFFENDLEGSYLVRTTTVKMNGTSASTSVTIYLCTPNA